MEQGGVGVDGERRRRRRRRLRASEREREGYEPGPIASAGLLRSSRVNVDDFSPIDRAIVCVYVSIFRAAPLL